VSKPLTGTSILIADDQIDVVRTLCSSLRDAGASLQFVPDGQTALDHISTHPVDLVVVDLKMPPEEWGGLWLLEQLQNQQQRVPAIVLSGEGWDVLRDAFRLGAVDYIDKTEVVQDLLPHCTKILDKVYQEALDKASKELPAPLAYRFARYQSTADPEKKLSKGFHALEEILRIGAIIGLSATEPAPLRGVTRQQLSALSMGTWLDLCTALANHPGVDIAFTRFWSWLVPKKADRDPIRNLVNLRNQIAHGRPADRSMGASLEPLLRRFAHRALSLWRAELAVPQAMTYDGESFATTYVSVTGPGPHKLGTIPTTRALTTGRPILLTPTHPPLPLTPWLVAHRDEATGAIRCWQFDGTTRKPGTDHSIPLRYAPTDGQPDEAPATIPGAGCWGDLERWATGSIA
jgi:CheY-like chemotaxis protein